jgi:hypothetical protein
MWQIGKNKFSFHLLNPFKTDNISYNNQKGANNMATQTNYSVELTSKIVSDYQAGTSVEDIASAIDKSVRSVRSKLVREGVYVAKPTQKSTKVMGPTKKELLIELNNNFGYDVSGLEGATKEAISHLMTVLAQ